MTMAASILYASGQQSAVRINPAPGSAVQAMGSGDPAQLDN